MDSKPLLVLDLDETLIHSSDIHLGFDCDFEYPAPKTLKGQYWVYKRPHLDSFIECVQKHYDLAIWSSGSKDYVHTLVEDFLKLKDLKFIYSREHCLSKKRSYEYGYLKPLRKVTGFGYDLERILMVDDIIENCQENLSSAIIISEFLGNSGDEELKLLTDYLILIKDSEDFRKINKDYNGRLK